uniref:Uncharacterized protein n=1 Tax=Ananas comosus var. bracteatus TaxID=296719 RepID=A0A6V7PLH8_ANACO|nr:unnamed protein product [Ananas comosus var. bracteatus]
MTLLNLKFSASVFQFMKIIDIRNPRKCTLWIRLPEVKCICKILRQESQIGKSGSIEDDISPYDDELVDYVSTPSPPMYIEDPFTDVAGIGVSSFNEAFPTHHEQRDRHRIGEEGTAASGVLEKRFRPAISSSARAEATLVAVAVHAVIVVLEGLDNADLAVDGHDGDEAGVDGVQVDEAVGADGGDEGVQDLHKGSPACAVPNGPVVVNIPTLGMSLPHGIPFRRPIPHGRAYVEMAISGVPACGERPSQACANEHNGKQA